jgi:hypothetical protein
MRLIKTIGVVAALCVGSPALAWDGVVSGTITSIDVTGATNYAFRVGVGGYAGSYCGGVANFAYINATDDNYSAYVAALISAKVVSSMVDLYLVRDSNGYCQIGYISVH